VELSSLHEEAKAQHTTVFGRPEVRAGARAAGQPWPGPSLSSVISARP
jgi:hypothetical protein